MLPDALFKLIDKIIVNIEGFPCHNATDFISISIVRFSNEINKAAKSKKEFDELINEIIKQAKVMIEEETISDKLYGWQEKFKRLLKR